MCLISSTILSETFLILRRMERDMIRMYIGLHVKYPLLLLDFNETWILLDSFSKNPQISYFMKIRPVGAELFHVERRTDGYCWSKFRNFANASKNLYLMFTRSADHIIITLQILITDVISRCIQHYNNQWYCYDILCACKLALVGFKSYTFYVLILEDYGWPP